MQRNVNLTMKSFQSFRLDAADHSLWRGEKRVQIIPKAFDVLCYMVENAGRLVSQDELLQALWPETYVNQEVLRKYILEIRKALGDRPEKPEFIETVTKRGYRFIAPVIDGSVAKPPDLPISQATEEDATEEKVGNEAAPPEQETTWSGCGCDGRPRRVLSARTKWVACSVVEQHIHRRAALCGHEHHQRPGVFFRWIRRATD